MLRQAVPRHGVPVVPGVGHVVDELEDYGEGSCREKKWGGGGESCSEAQEPDRSPEPDGQLYDEVLTQ